MLPVVLIMPFIETTFFFAPDAIQEHTLPSAVLSVYSLSVWSSSPASLDSHFCRFLASCFVELYLRLLDSFTPRLLRAEVVLTRLLFRGQGCVLDG